MGLWRIRSKDVHRANDDEYFCKVLKLLKGATTPDEIITRCERETLRLGMRYVNKSSSSMRWSKYTTTWYSQVRLGSNFRDRSRLAQAATWAHEMIHVYQWRGEGRGRFGTRYIGYPGRWRWAYEMQAYRMSIHIRKVLKVTTSSTKRYIRDKHESMRKTYSLGGFRSSDLRNKTREVLYDELDRGRAA